MNTLYYGDNLDVLRRYVGDESVDLVYLDPPFNSNATYNVLFAEQNGSRAAAQVKAFEDAWRWDQVAAAVYQETVEAGGQVSLALQAFRTFLGESDMMAYLAMMAPRLVELRRVLKQTGSIYLHCDPTASHYLKMLLDAIFGPGNFKNEICWKRTFAHGSAKRFGPVHDIILFYARSDEMKWTGLKVKHDDDYLKKHFNHIEENTGRYFQPISLTGAGVTQGDSGKPWRNIDPSKVGRHWAIPTAILELLGIAAETTQEKLEALDSAGRIFWPKKEHGTPRLKWYLDELAGAPAQDVWTDISPVSAQASERLTYPTQKPEVLLERIISASSNEGDVVLDPFCGCGTAVAVAQRLNRRWIGIDITHLAITLIRHRLKDAFGESAAYEVVGEPTSVPDAETLAAEDPYQFQWWALGLVGARPVEQKKGSDKGIDGRLFFHDEGESGKTKQVILSVKAGHTNVTHVRDLRGVLDREKAEIGVLIVMEEPTRPMRTEAASGGYYTSPGWGRDYPKLQILTVAEILAGKGIDMPPIRHVSKTFKKAPRAKRGGAQTTVVPFDSEESGSEDDV